MTNLLILYGLNFSRYFGYNYSIISQIKHRKIMAKRTFVLLFGIFSYLIGVSGLVAWILCMLGVIPFQFGIAESMYATVTAYSIMLLMVFVFALQHTVMARNYFKSKITKLIAPEMERPLFVLMTGIIILLTLFIWPINPEIVWEVSQPGLQLALTGFAILGWVYLFAASFAINHFELFGLQQSFNYFQNKKSTQIPFKERLMYKFDRHPIMTGALIGMWSTPLMSLDHFFFSLFFTFYIIFGVSIEEKDLISQWGDTYIDYKNRVFSIVPTMRSKK
jgi:protein-S-isoprenylcysteine O-methyltransferase Ste14